MKMNVSPVSEQLKKRIAYSLVVGALTVYGCAPEAKQPYNSVSPSELTNLNDQADYVQLASQDRDLLENNYLIETAESDGPDYEEDELADSDQEWEEASDNEVIAEQEESDDILLSLSAAKKKPVVKKVAKKELPKNPPIPTKRPNYKPAKKTEIAKSEKKKSQSSGTSYSLPPYQSSWGLSKKVYQEADKYFYSNKNKFPNTRYVTVIDFSKHSSKKRMFVFDLKTKKVEKYNTSHGQGSDPKNSGLAKLFSNSMNSHKTSLGAYKTLDSGKSKKHGTVGRLMGLQASNSNALARAIIIHKAKYVNEAGRAGRSHGCFALDTRVYLKVINKVKGGSLLYVGR
ncbi:MAG: murein L,D-transpeptidase catalytic domain family protein [Oligoflexia bacterium]|nr:murein L,D-transpeptidase catalytic domain family protein [Oligoflexia bacterium]